MLLAATGRGLVRSADVGRTWTPEPTAPPLAVLAWPGEQSLFGVAADGDVVQSPDGGRTWARRGSAGGQPEALAVEIRGGAPTVFVAVADRGIRASTDGGQTFTTRYAE